MIKPKNYLLYEYIENFGHLFTQHIYSIYFPLVPLKVFFEIIPPQAKQRGEFRNFE